MTAAPIDLETDLAARRRARGRFARPSAAIRRWSLGSRSCSLMVLIAIFAP